jgi:hypothetical protein
MKFLFIISLFFCFKAHAQSDTAHAMRVKYFSISNDSMQLNVTNGRVVIRQFKDHQTIFIYPVEAVKVDTAMKKMKAIRKYILKAQSDSKK